MEVVGFEGWWMESAAARELLTEEVVVVGRKTKMKGVRVCEVSTKIEGVIIVR